MRTEDLAGLFIAYAGCIVSCVVAKLAYKYSCSAEERFEGQEESFWQNELKEVRNQSTTNRTRMALLEKLVTEQADQMKTICTHFSSATSSTGFGYATAVAHRGC